LQQSTKVAEGLLYMKQFRVLFHQVLKIVVWMTVYNRY